MAAALAMLVVFGAVLAAASLAIHLNAYKSAVDALNPGFGGSALLLLAGLVYLPNSVVWAIAYMLGPGFAFGVGTAVSPSGSALGALPAFPMLAALPVGVRAAFPPWLGFFILLMPYLAGALAGLMTVRIAPTPLLEAAPLWGLLTGVLTAVVIGFAAKLSAGRLVAVGPAGGEIGLVAVLEIGVTAALVAGAANWVILRTHIRRLSAAAPPDRTGSPLDRVSGPMPRGGAGRLVVDQTDSAGGHHIYVDPWAADHDS
jgi:hypothetical protein